MYFQDPFTDLMFLLTLSKHAFEGSEIAECYSAAAQIREGDVQSSRDAWNAFAENVEALATSAEVDTRAITCPTLALNDSNDYSELLQQARAAVATIAYKNVATRVFTPEDGSNYRQTDNFGLKHRTMFDWLDGVLKVSGDARQAKRLVSTS